MDTDKLELRKLYVDLAVFLAKENTDEDADYITEITEEAEPKVMGALLGILRSSRASFLRKFKNPEHEDQITEVISNSFPDSASTKLLDVLTPIAKTVIKATAAKHDLDTDFDQANGYAITSLQKQTKNFFTTLSDDVAKGVLANIAQEKEDQHDLDDIKDSVRAAYGKDLTFVDKDGNSRTLDNDTWARLVARTEGTRAASEGSKAALQDAGMLTWTWITESEGCDDCSDNDGETVEIDQAFPSGDTQPPVHPNCRCSVIPNVSELTSDDAGDDQDKEQDHENSSDSEPDDTE